MSKQTPGPWEWWTSNSVRRLTGADGKDGGVLYAYRAASDGVADIAVSDANARLIAASPDLLEACKTFVEWLRREDEGMPQEWRDKRDTPEGEAAWREWFDGNVALCSLAQSQARAAIAKVEGKS